MENKQLQDKYLEYQMLVNHLKQLEQQFILLEQHLNELRNLNEGLDELIATSEKDIFSSVGGGVFVKSELKEKDNVLVNVGAGVVVKKNINDAKKMIARQIGDVQNLVLEIQDEFNRVNDSVNVLREELSKENK